MNGLVLAACWVVAHVGEAASLPGVDAASAPGELSVFDILEEERTAYSVTLSKQTPEEAPALVVVRLRDELLRYQFRTLAEVLDFVAGIDMLYDTDFYDVGVRGLFGDVNANGAAVKIMVDGVETAFRTTGHNAFGADQIPIDAIERIEIIRGPASAVYGANAFLGVINIVTRADTKSGASAWARARSLWQRATATAGGSVEHKGERVFAGGSVSATYDDQSGATLPGATPGTALRSTRDTGVRVAANVHAGVRVAEGLELRLDSIATLVDASAQFQPLSVLNPGNRASFSKSHNQLKLNWTKDWLLVEVGVTLAVGATNPDARIDYGLSGFSLWRDQGYIDGGARARVAVTPNQAYSGWLLVDADIDREHMNRTLAVPLGARLSAGRELSPEGIVTAAGVRAIPLLWNVAVATHHTYRPVKLLGLTLGGRWDHHSIYGNNFSGRAGAVINLDTVGYLKLLGGRSFKAPTPQQLFWSAVGAADFQGNERLPTQLANTLELVAGTRAVRGLEMRATGFISWVSDRAIYVQGNAHLQAQAISNARSLGVEAEVQLSPLSLAADTLELAGELGFAWQNTQAQLSSLLAPRLTSENVLFPVWKATALASLGIRPAHLRLIARGNFGADRFASQSTVQALATVVKVPGKRVVDLGIAGWNLDGIAWWPKGLGVDVMARNLLGSTRVLPGYNGTDVPAEPTTVEINLRWVLN